MQLERRLWSAFALATVAAAAAAFWTAGLRATDGVFPAPLDDVYIHFGFARSLALGHPFEWMPGNGFSSGATSLTYPVLLAPAWLLGLRGPSLGFAAFAIALLCLFDLCRSLRALTHRAPAPVAWAIPPLVVSIPLLDWSWFSCMETAVLGAVLGRALVALDRVGTEDDPGARARRQLVAGLWLAALPATRPETVVLSAALALAVAHAGRTLSALGSLARAGTPTLAHLFGQAALNRAFTGEIAAAGAVRKLLLYDPYAAPADVAFEVLKNLAVLRIQAFDVALGGRPFAWALPALAALALASRSRRRLVVPLAIGGVGTLALVSLNATARFQNLRYAAPALAMLVAGAAIGLGAARSRAARVLSAVLFVAALVGPARHFSTQIDHFARSCANIAGQQVEVARRIAALSPRRVLVNDAGAIPYLSNVPAIDGLGLGGFARLPFARASVHGVPAVVELIERIPPPERPVVLAVYADWWRGLADVFGTPIDRVRILDNVICGADEKVLYAVDWSALSTAGPSSDAPLGVVDELDVADLVAERAHGYRGAGTRTGWVVAAIQRLPDGRRRWDAGRIIPAGRAESFEIASPDVASSTLVVRTDSVGGARLDIAVMRGAVQRAHQELAIPDPGSGSPDAVWRELRVPLGDVGRGDRVILSVRSGAWRSFHTWIVRP